jgi:tripartite-type tricarboxylate transporter receptor subunit TctC
MFLAACAAVVLAAGPAMADWPNDKPIKIIIPYTPGGGVDTYVRGLAPVLAEQLGPGVTVVPENIPGAGGKKGSSVLYKADPDGYTIGILNVPGITVAKARGDKLSFDPDKFTWLVKIADSPYGISTSSKSEMNTIKDLCNLGRPAKFAQTGPTSSGYVTAVIVMKTMGCDYKMVTGYKGTSQAITAMLRREVDASMRPLGSTAKYVKSGDLKILMELTPDGASAVGHPKLGQLGLKRMMAGPPGMSEDLTMKLSEALVRTVNTDEIKALVKKRRDKHSPAGAAEAQKIHTELGVFYEQYKDLMAAK